MSTMLFTLVFLHITLIRFSLADDGVIMEKLKLSLGSSTPKDWESPNFCSWTGIQCDNSSRITIINVKSKSLRTILPEDINTLLHLNKLSLSNNRLYGRIPSFANMSLLEVVILSHNNLTGLIPETLTSLPHLRILDLSYNKLTGPIPMFRSSVNFNCTGNLLLRQNQNDSNSGNSVNSVAVIVGGVMGALVLIGVVVIVAHRCYIVANQPRLGRVRGTNVGLLNPPIGMPTFDIQVLRSATNSFSDENFLGRGGHAAVYKGEINGNIVAIKRMDIRRMATDGLNQFQAEIDALTRVRHRNLVALLGYCITEDEKILVYEYMSQGTLNQHLFQPQQNSYAPLDWEKRISIALGVARGMEYLHSGTGETLIHRDLTPNNILLDHGFTAKVSDFGLVKIISQGDNSLVHTLLAGTIGYIAPEILETISVTRKVDVYSFGVILMQLVTGRRAVDESRPEDEQAIVPWFKRVFNYDNPDSIRQYVDPIIDINGDTFHSILIVVKLALNCTAREPHHRGEMSSVVAALLELVVPPLVVQEDETQDTTAIDLLQRVRRWEANEFSTSSGSY